MQWTQINCAEVIDSNRLSLQQIKLTSFSWTHATYAALGGVPNLQGVVLRVDILNKLEATLISSLKHPCSVQVKISRCWTLCGRILRLLSGGCAKISVLHLVNLRSFQCQQLQSMHHLRSLALIQPSFVRASDFWHLQPAVTHLQFASDTCYLDQCQHESVLEKFPALQNLNGRALCEL